MGLFRHALQVSLKIVKNFDLARMYTKELFSTDVQFIAGTIACVSIAIDGHLMLAVNVEDFRNLANRFLSKELADKLTILVSETSLWRKKENTQIVENKLPVIKEKPIKESARTNQHTTETTEAVTDNYKPKRFNTVKNSDSTELLRQVIYITPPGPVYVRDEIEDLLQNINEGNSDNDNGRIKVYHPERIDERDYNIVSKEATRSLNLNNMSKDTHNKIDYTETKLGEWKYNQDISKEPPEIKNIKTGNADKDINDEGSIDYEYYDKAKMHESTENVKNVQYVYETRLLGRFKNKYDNDVKVTDHQVDKEEKIYQPIVYTKPKDNFLRKPHKERINNIRMPKKQLLVLQTKISTTKDDSHIFEEHILGKKNKINHENTPPEQDDATISQNIKEVKIEPKKSKMLLNDFPKDSPEVKQHKSKEKETYQKPPPMQPIENNDMYEKYALGSQIKNNNNNKKGVIHQSVEDGKEKHNRETKKIQNEDDNKNVGDQSGSIEHNINILRNKNKYLIKNEVPEYSGNNSKKVPPKQFFTRRPHYDEDKFENNKSKPEVSIIKYKKVKQPVHERYGTSTEETKEDSKEGKKDIGKKKPHASKEENDLYDKFELGSENKKSNKRKPKQQAEDSNKIKKPIKANKIDKYDEQHIKDNNKSSYKTLLLLRKKQRFKDSVYCKQNPNSNICRKEEVTTKIALKESAEVSRPHSVKGNKEGFSDHTVRFKIKDHQVNKSDNYDLINGAKQKNTHKRRPQKKIEENDMYDKYELGGETKDNDDKNVKKQKENRDDIKTKDDKNKFNYQGRYKDKFASNEEVPIKSKRKPQKKIEENDMYDKYDLSREGKSDDDRNVKKQKQNRDDIKTKDDKNKLNYQGRYKDKFASNEEMPIKSTRKPQKKIEENDMYDKYELGREGKNDDDRNVTKLKENRDDIKTKDDKNKLNYQGRYKDKFANNKEMPIKSTRKPQKKIEENDMYDKFELGRETDNDDKINRQQKENRNDIKTMANKNKFNDHGRIKDESANNEEMPIKSNKRYKNVEDTTTTKHKETKKGQGQIEKAPIAAYADDPQLDFKEAKPESIKANTESLLDSEEPKGKGRPTKKFTMKGTIVPKRDFYKLSSPNYYKDLPRVVEKYDFEEPIPEQDRVRDKVEYLKREPSMVNRKVKLPKYEKT